jgi:hypothetical protein
MKEIGIVVLATGKYFVLGLRILHRINHFYTGNLKLVFHFFSENNPKDYLALDNIIYHKVNNVAWNETMLQKLQVIQEAVETENHDYFLYVDADTNVYKKFDNTYLANDSFIAEHWMNEAPDIHYEKNPLSSAYISPEKYPKFYYQANYFGGTKSNMLSLLKTSIKLFKKDLSNGTLARAEDESYINKYLSVKPPSKSFDPTSKNFPFVIGDKGQDTHRIWGKTIKEMFDNQNYEQLLFQIKQLRNQNVLWNIQNHSIVIEN